MDGIPRANFLKIRRDPEKTCTIRVGMIPPISDMTRKRVAQHLNIPDTTNIPVSLLIFLIPQLLDTGVSLDVSDIPAQLMPV